MPPAVEIFRIVGSSNKDASKEQYKLKNRIAKNRKIKEIKNNLFAVTNVTKKLINFSCEITWFYGMK